MTYVITLTDQNITLPDYQLVNGNFCITDNDYALLSSVSGGSCTIHNNELNEDRVYESYHIIDHHEGRKLVLDNLMINTGRRSKSVTAPIIMDVSTSEGNVVQGTLDNQGFLVIQKSELSEELPVHAMNSSTMLKARSATNTIQYDIREVIEVGDEVRCILKSYPKKIFTIILKDGTTFENVLEEFDNYHFVVDYELDFDLFTEENCSQMTVYHSAEDPFYFTEHNYWTNKILSEQYKDSSGYHFSFKDL